MTRPGGASERSAAARPDTGVWLALIAILLVGALLRFGRVDLGLPSVFLSDEELLIKNALSLPARQTLEPLYFDYPTLHLYLVSALCGALFVAGRVVGLYQSAADFGVRFFVDPTAVYLVARGLSAALSVAALFVVYRLGRRLYGTRAALFGALLLAVGIQSCSEAGLTTPNATLAFLAILALIPIHRVATAGRLRDYVIAGAAIGLAVSAKYNSGLLVLSLAVAHFSRSGGGAGLAAPRRRLALLLSALAAAALAFFATTPHWILSFDRYLDEYLLQASHMRTGHMGRMEGPPIWWAIEAIARQEKTAGLLAIAGVCIALFRRGLGDRLLLAFVVPSFLAISLLRNQQLDYLSALWPPAALLGGRALDAALSVRPLARSPALAWLVGAAVLLPSLAGALTDLHQARITDTRERAREWIEANVPAGAGIAFDSYHKNVQLLDAGRARRSQLGRDHMDAAFLDSVESALASRPSYRLVRLLEASEAPNLPPQVDSLPDPAAFRRRVERDRYLARQVFGTRNLSPDELIERGAEYLLLSSYWTDRFLVQAPPPRDNPLYLYWLGQRAYYESLLADPRLTEIRRWEPGADLAGPRITLFRFG